MSVAAKTRKRTKKSHLFGGFKSHRDRLVFMMSMIGNDSTTCLNDVMNQAGLTPIEKQWILALAIGNESQVK
ncbi:hypothetical protein [Staphylospora marina]|uniref:hypothetical protein n=1 Tax=Staphylospora marina TaxID=2490858 RepID=UPI000F5BF70C|nr:hypothetical protein [Staphylospora marina]